MSVTIQLTHTNPVYQVTLTRENILSLKGSLLVSSLEMDPEAVVVPIHNPIVRPQDLEALVRMARREPLQYRNVSEEEEKAIKGAADYLDWPLLVVELIPLLPEFAPYADLYRPETFGPLLPWSIRWQHPFLTRYILRMTEPGPMDTQGFLVAIYYRDLETVNVLLKRGINPKTAYINMTVLRDLIPDAEFVFSQFAEKTHQALKLLALSFHPVETDRQLLSLLSQHAEGEYLQRLFEGAAVGCREDVAIELIKQGRVDPNKLGSAGDVFHYLAKNHMSGLAMLLVATPKFHLSDSLRSKLREWFQHNETCGIIGSYYGRALDSEPRT